MSDLVLWCLLLSVRLGLSFLLSEELSQVPSDAFSLRAQILRLIIPVPLHQLLLSFHCG